MDPNNVPPNVPVALPVLPVAPGAMNQVSVDEERKTFLGRLFSRKIGRLSYFVGMALYSGLVWLIAKIPYNPVVFFPQIILMLLIIALEAGLVIRRLRDLNMYRWLFFVVFVPVIDILLAGILFFKPGEKKESLDISVSNLIYIFKEILALNSNPQQSSLTEQINPQPNNLIIQQYNNSISLLIPTF